MCIRDRASMTETGTTLPDASNIWVIPIFLPISIIFFQLPGVVTRSLGLDLDVDTGRQHQLGEVIDRLLRRMRQVDQALVHPDLELLARLFVYVGRTKHRVHRAPRRKRNRPDDTCTRATRRADDVVRRAVEGGVLVRLELDSDSLAFQHSISSFRSSTVT